MSSPAEIVRAMLVKQGLVTLPVIVGQTIPYVQTPNDYEELTPCYVSKLIDDVDQLVCIMDTVGTLSQRPMRGGKQDRHPGVKVIVRTLDYTGYALINNIAVAFDGFTAGTVTTDDGVVHYLQSIYRTTTIVPMSEDIGKQRQLWSLNARVAFQDAEPSLG